MSDVFLLCKMSNTFYYALKCERDKRKTASAFLYSMVCVCVIFKFADKSNSFSLLFISYPSLGKAD